MLCFSFLCHYCSYILFSYLIFYLCILMQYSRRITKLPHKRFIFIFILLFFTIALKSSMISLFWRISPLSVVSVFSVSISLFFVSVFREQVLNTAHCSHIFKKRSALFFTFFLRNNYSNPQKYFKLFIIIVVAYHIYTTISK